jgi:Lar family restriction alleviation protein
MTEELKPCPFCGGEAVGLFPDSYPSSVECEACAFELNYYVEGASEASKAGVIAAWNRRALSAPPAPVGGGEWPSIDTAPRDGSWFVARQNGEAFPCQWVELEGEGWVYEGGSAGWLDLFNDTLEEPAEWQGVILGGPDPKPAALSSPPSQEGLREALRTIVAKWERGPNHDEGAFDADCETCLILADFRSLLAALSSPPLEGEGQADQELGSFQSPAAPSTPVGASGASPADATVPEGYALVPLEPSPGLLMSMAVRSDHGLGCPGYYDQGIFGGEGIGHARRLECALAEMRKLHEEVVGAGFYSGRREGFYTALAAETEKASQAQSTGAQPEGRSEHKAPANPGKEEGA